jgi:hypothetical protein
VPTKQVKAEKRRFRPLSFMKGFLKKFLTWKVSQSLGPAG